MSPQSQRLRVLEPLPSDGLADAGHGTRHAH